MAKKERPTESVRRASKIDASGAILSAQLLNLNTARLTLLYLWNVNLQNPILKPRLNAIGVDSISETKATEEAPLPPLKSVVLRIRLLLR